MKSSCCQADDEPGAPGSTPRRGPRLNAVIRRWKKDSEPLVEKQPGSVKEPPKSPFLDSLQDADLERDDARRGARST